MSYRRQVLPISQLVLDQNNPRYDAVGSQDEAMNQMILSDPDGISNLAKDIAERGLSPSELPIIYEDIEANYIVKDGNRRISAIDAIVRPNRLPADQSILRKRFQGYQQESKIRGTFKDIRKILCCVFDDEDEADEWVYLRHTGENNGVGTVKWDSLQKKRFVAHQTGFAPSELVAYNLAEACADADTKLLMGQKFSITNLERLLGDDDFRKKMGFVVEDRMLKFSIPEEEAMRNLNQVVKDIATKRKKVGAFMDRDKRLEYAEELKTMGFLRGVDELPTAIPVPEIQTPIDPTTPVDVRQVRRRRREQRPIGERVALLPSDFELSINLPRANDVYHEMKKLNVRDYPNAVSMEYRVFLEFSVNQYIKGKNIPGISPSSDLITKIKRVADHFKNQRIMTDQELVGIRSLCNEDGSRPIPLVMGLNQYIHNDEFNPDPQALKTSWMNLQSFIMKLWDDAAG